MSCSLVWFRQDLRIQDNPALQAAIERGQPVVPVYIHAPEEAGQWAHGGASNWWLHQALKSLDAELKKYSSQLIMRTAAISQDALMALISETGADAVYWNRCYEPFAIARDKAIKETLKTDGLLVESFKANVLFEPWTVENKSKKTVSGVYSFLEKCIRKTDTEYCAD